MLKSGNQPMVVRFADGRILKGTAQDFSPNRESFHLFPWGEEGGKPLEIIVDELKAVFFVEDYEGDSTRRDDNSFDNARGQGRKLLVYFRDGEVIAGFTMGYNPAKKGFFLIPADPQGNNRRVYVVNAAVDRVDPAPAAEPGSAATG